VGAARVAVLIAGSILAVFPWRRFPGWLGPALLAAAALAVRIVPVHAARVTADDLTNAILFLLLAVPLAVLLDRSGFFAALAGVVGGGRHLRAGLWVLAALVTVVFNLDAAVVLLTPLYVRIADRHGDDPVLLGFIPALLATMSSSVLPVSNLTNLIVADRLDLGAGAFLAHMALPSLAATVVGGLVFARLAGREHVTDAGAAPLRQPLDKGPLRVGFPVVVWLLFGFTVGERFGVPAWVVVLPALVVLAVRERVVPWRSVPMHAAVLAAGLGTLATAAAPHLPVERLLAVRGMPGELATVGAMVLGANAINNLPALLVTLPALEHHHERVWAVLLGSNLGPALWVTGALSTLLWQATMQRLGHPISAMRYARTAIRVGVPALVAATVVHVLIVLSLR
jgi:arsenical pump membrane protein